MRALLDTNVVCDWLLKRDPWRTEAETIAQWIEQGKLECLIAATTVTNLFYVARKLVGREVALSHVGRCLTSFEICPVDYQSLQEAHTLPSGNFEDNVQMIVAVLAAADCIVTRDAKGFPNPPLPVLPPSDFVSQLRATHP